VGNVGSAVVDFTALGDPINVAAGLQARAGAGQVVVAADVRASLREVLSPGARRQTLRVGGRETALPVCSSRTSEVPAYGQGSAT
jgi:adenylate cyclase